MVEESGEAGEPSTGTTVPPGYGEIPDPPPKGRAGSDDHKPHPPLPHGPFHPMPDPGDETDVAAYPS